MGEVMKVIANEQRRKTGFNLGQIKTTEATSYEDFATAAKNISEIDKYDSFSELLIEPNSYMQTPESYGYGIKYDNKLMHIDSVILKHQSAAAQKFLSDFKGIGILADEVGMGKTYEAGVILSELAERGVIESLLIVVTNDEMVSFWKDTLEMKFGMGKNLILRVKKQSDIPVPSLSGEIEDIVRPTRPIITTYEDFNDWYTGRLGNICFDAIVIDEAHNLCDPDLFKAKSQDPEEIKSKEKQNKTMTILQELMKIKHIAGKPYCILISGTPHQGNLENMFPLWFFIDSGGKPQDEYYMAKRKKHYDNNLRRNAKTVSEFVANVRRERLEGNERFMNWLKTQRPPRNKTEERYLTNRFLSLDENADLKAKIDEEVKKAYNYGLMGEFMIRQPRPRDIRGRTAVNLYFFPSKVYEGLPVVIRNHQLTVAQALFYLEQGKLPPEEYETVLEAIKNAGGFDTIQNGGLFKKRDSEMYYVSQWRNRIRGITNGIRFALSGSEEDIFEAKVKELLKIAHELKDDKIIVFTDDGMGGNIADKLYSRLNRMSCKDVFERIISKRDGDTKTIVEKFQRSKNALLIAEKELEEGANLQYGCNKLINFSVTPNPSQMNQRKGRIDRMGQSEDMIRIYSFAAMHELEGYVLAYYNRVELYTDDKYDIVIMSGSNEQLSVLRCKNLNCGNIKLDIATNRYCEYCNEESMTDMNDAAFLCNNEKCGYELKRTQGANEMDSYSYVCFQSQKGKLVQPDPTKREYMCDKICAMRHCRFFESMTEDKCGILKTIRSNASVDINKLTVICAKCQERKLNPDCKIFCSLLRPNVLGDGVRGRQCIECGLSKCEYKPYVISFQEGKEGAWAKCPKCGKGILQHEGSATFEQFVKKAWEFEYNGKDHFVENFRAEARKTIDTAEVLRRES